MLEEIMYYACAIISFTVALTGHEVAHGFAAYKLGDPTAKRAGRLSLNPLKHIDPFGTVILPLMLMVLHMPIFGYAKPVPYNPSYFKDPRKGDAITGFAGPAANLVMAVLAALLAHVVFGLAPHILQSQTGLHAGEPLPHVLQPDSHPALGRLFYHRRLHSGAVAAEVVFHPALCVPHIHDRHHRPALRGGVQSVLLVSGCDRWQPGESVVPLQDLLKKAGASHGIQG